MLNRLGWVLVQPTKSKILGPRFLGPVSRASYGKAKKTKIYESRSLATKASKRLKKLTTEEYTRLGLPSGSSPKVVVRQLALTDHSTIKLLK